MNRIERLRNLIRHGRAVITPSATAWRGAATGVALLMVAVSVFYFSSYILQDFTWQKLPAFVVQTGALILAGLGGLLLLAILQRLERGYRISLLLFAPFVMLVLPQGDDASGLLFGAALLLIASTAGAALAVLNRHQWRLSQHRAATTGLVASCLAIAAGLYAIFSPVDDPNPWMQDYQIQDRTLDLPNPGLPGPYSVATLTYGSGRPQPRSEFGEQADLVARSVDGSKLIDNWDGFSGWLRSRYWGFDATALPLQARVWYPQGDGPFPLVLIVHGNHSMEDFSDPGYGYLGELFASRGIILASVDENFLNSSVSARVELFADRPGLEEENDARGWLLLQHLAQWRDWNNEAGHTLGDKVDMQRVALIGHSRGGEAVAVAAAFNPLSHYPDDATLAFDFGFDLRGVIAIAPVDGQYQPREKPTPIRNVSYFTIHGSMDGDVQSFDGTAQYARVRFDDDDFHFRSSLYVHGANHGQFNTTWGNLDTGVFRAWALDTARLMGGEEQRDVARVYFSAFMEVVLNDRREYLPVFEDLRRAAGWLPPTFYVNQYSDTNYRVLADFEEDIDPGTASLPGSRIAATNLSRWYETANAIKYDDLDSHAAVLAWDERYADGARIDFGFPGDGLQAGTGQQLLLSLAAAGVDSLPADFDRDTLPAADDKRPAPLTFTVALTDRAGEQAAVSLSSDDFLYPQVQALPRRAAFLESEDPSEVLFRRYALPLAGFRAENPALDTGRLWRLSLVFDRSPRGAIIVDDIGMAPVAPVH